MKIVKILLMILFMTGCATSSFVKRESDAINSADGISKKEAIAMARMSMINSKLDDDYHLWAVSTYDNGLGYWRIVFSSLYFNRHECVLIIEKSTGDILAFFEAIDENEAAIGANPAYSIDEWKAIKKFD